MSIRVLMVQMVPFTHWVVIMRDDYYYMIEYSREHGKRMFPTKKSWLEEGPAVFHNLEGPAWVLRSGAYEYWIDGHFYENKEDYFKTLEFYKRLPKIIRKCHKLWWVRKL